jgi:multidrug transporter EmrE-like cation transporter
MSAGLFGLIMISVTLSAVAQISFKFGVSEQPSELARNLLGPLAILLTPGVALGLTLYGVGTVLWLTALGRLELSQAYPFVGVGFALTTLAGWWLFGDDLSVQRLSGVVLIVAGITLLARS